MDLTDIIYDETETTRTRFLCFAGQTQRFDLVLVASDRFYGKFLVLDLQSNRFAILGPDDLKKPHYLSEVYELEPAAAKELTAFLELFIM